MRRKCKRKMLMSFQRRRRLRRGNTGRRRSKTRKCFKRGRRKKRKCHSRRMKRGSKKGGQGREEEVNIGV